MESVNNSVVMPSISSGDSAHDGNEVFSRYVTGTAFDLKLSKNQVRALSQFDYADSCIENYLTVSALQGKGLISKRSGAGWEITEAGKQVIVLLKMAGVYEAREDMLGRLGLSNVQKSA